MTKIPTQILEKRLAGHCQRTMYVDWNSSDSPAVQICPALFVVNIVICCPPILLIFRCICENDM